MKHLSQIRKWESFKNYRIRLKNHDHLHLSDLRNLQLVALSLYHGPPHWADTLWGHISCCKYSGYLWNAGLFYTVKNSCRFWCNFQVCFPLFQALIEDIFYLSLVAFCCLTHTGGKGFSLCEVSLCQKEQWSLHSTNAMIAAWILL